MKQMAAERNRAASARLFQTNAGNRPAGFSPATSSTSAGQAEAIAGGGCGSCRGIGNSERNCCATRLVLQMGQILAPGLKRDAQAGHFGRPSLRNARSQPIGPKKKPRQNPHPWLRRPPMAAPTPPQRIPENTRRQRKSMVLPSSGLSLSLHLFPGLLRRHHRHLADLARYYLSLNGAGLSRHFFSTLAAAASLASIAFNWVARALILSLSEEPCLTAHDGVFRFVYGYVHGATTPRRPVG